MAIKPFEIQGSTLSIGGVELNSSADGKVVIPGVTRSTGYRVEEVEDSGDQTTSFQTIPVVIDYTTWQVFDQFGSLNGQGPYAGYLVEELDDDGFIDGLVVDTNGTYAANELANEGNDMYAYVGSGDPFAPFVGTDWVQIPFRPRMKSTGIESEFGGGGSGGAIVERSVNFPNGEDGDTRGTIALTPDGKTYVCVGDYENNSSQYQGDYEAEQSEPYNVGQSGGSFNVVTFLVSAEPELYYILQNDSGDNSAFQVDAGEAFGGPQTISYYGYNETTISFTWPYRSGVDPADIETGTPVTITYSGTLNQQPIWKRIVDVTSSGGEGDGTINWTSDGDLTIETTRPNGYTGDCDINIDAADDVFIYAHGDQAQVRAQTNIELLSNTSYVRIITADNAAAHQWTFSEDGSLKLPQLNNTGYQAGYSLNGPTLLLGGENDPNDQVIITGPVPNNINPSSQRLIVQGQKGFGGEDNNKGEGGDVYIWAGTGGDGGSLSSQGDGGDIKLRGGQGGQGGYVRIEGGAATATGSTGGFIDVNAGDGVTNGGDVHIRAGSGGTNNGEVNVYTTSNSHQWIFKNDGSLQLPVGGDIRDSNGVSILGGGSGGAELQGNGYVAETGVKRTVYSNWLGKQGGESTSLSVLPADASGIAVGDTVTFRNGEIRTITELYSYEDHSEIYWDVAVDGNGTNPRYPVVLQTTNYVAETKKTARIKPDMDTEGSGQYMDVYVGGSMVLDNKHVHMAGHEPNTELFLGTDNNFVSVKEAGVAPASVNLKSENDITVSETNLRMTRGSTFFSAYGDGDNRNVHGNTNNLTWNVVCSDDAGNYYVGGEHDDWTEAMVAKYGPDGDLIWKKIINADVGPNGWAISGVAHNTTDNQVGFLVKTSHNRSYNYCKLVTFNAETGEQLITNDIYDADNGVDAYNMVWHPTLGYSVVGSTNGERLNSNALTATGNSGVGIIEVPLTSALLGGQYPNQSGGWIINGNNITTNQVLGQGVGLYRNVPLTAVTGIGSGATVGIKINYYPGGHNYEFYTQGNQQGQDYAYGDNLKVLGSLLGGVDGGTSFAATPSSIDQAGISNVLMYFPKATYPDLLTQLNRCTWTVQQNGSGPYTITSVAEVGANIEVITTSTDTTVGEITFSTADGNDLTCQAVENGALSNIMFVGGTPGPTNLRIDMAFNMGYTTEDFTGAQISFQFATNSRAFVWTSSWAKYYEPSNVNGYTYGYTIAVDPGAGLVVGGKDDNENRPFIWKLDANGSTTWVKILNNDNTNVYGLAVSRTNGSIYFATTYQSVNKLNSSGTLLKRVNTTGSWNFNTPMLELEQQLDGEEYLYVGGGYNGIWSNNSGFLVSKLTSDLVPVWSRNMYNNDSTLYTGYSYSALKHFVLGKDKATLVGYTYAYADNNYNGYLASISTTDNFEPGFRNNWYMEIPGGEVGYQNSTADFSTVNILTSGVTIRSSSLIYEDDTAGHVWINWTWKSIIVNLNSTTNGIVGVESIKFADGGTLDHNPGDIPASPTDFAHTGWAYTLQLSDRGRFIMNQRIPDNTSVQNLYITVPSNVNVSFPVGSVITLINSHPSTSNGWWIYVQPENWSNNDSPRIWATGYSYNSTWGFQGIQTATLMKIGSNEWLLTANNISDEN